MYSRYILLSALLVIGAETYAKNNKTEVESLLSYHNSVRNNSELVPFFLSSWNQFFFIFSCSS